MVNASFPYKFVERTARRTCLGVADSVSALTS